MRAVKTSNSKGVTPVVATMLLLTISVAATASAYTFITNTQQEVAQNFQDDIKERERQQQSGLGIDYMYNSTNPGNFTWMTVRNTGSITLPIREDGQKILSLYADGRPVESNVGDGGKGWKYVNAPKDLLNPAGTLTINTTVEFPAQQGESKSFKLVGPYSTSATHLCYNSGTPSC